MKHAIGRWLATASATIVAGTLTEWLIEPWFPYASDLNGTIYGTENSKTFHAIIIIGAGFGFWLAYTGRLARLFRKVG